LGVTLGNPRAWLSLLRPFCRPVGLPVVDGLKFLHGIDYRRTRAGVHCMRVGKQFPTIWDAELAKRNVARQARGYNGARSFHVGLVGGYGYAVARSLPASFERLASLEGLPQCLG
jgi:hypothetical protein